MTSFLSRVVRLVRTSPQLVGIAVVNPVSSALETLALNAAAQLQLPDVTISYLDRGATGAGDRVVVVSSSGVVPPISGS